jgi:hypothetical protein
MPESIKSKRGKQTMQIVVVIWSNLDKNGNKKPNRT